MRVLALEKLEFRKTAAADLVVALDSLQAEGEAISAVQVCRPHPPQVYEAVDLSIAILDIDQDGYISPTDAQLIVDKVSSQRTSSDLTNGPLPVLEAFEQSDEKRGFQLDVNQDGLISPADALMVINRVHFYNSLVPCTCSGCLANAIVDGL